MTLTAVARPVGDGREAVVEGHALLDAHEGGVGRGAWSQAQGTQAPRTAHTYHTVHTNLQPTHKAEKHHSDIVVKWCRHMRLCVCEARRLMSIKVISDVVGG